MAIVPTSSAYFHPSPLRSYSFPLPSLPFFQLTPPNSSKSCLSNVRATSSESPAPPAKPAPSPPKKPVLTMKKGQIVRVDKEKYLNSVEYLAVGHPLNYTGIDYIYEDRGEVLDVRVFDTGEYALVSWAGIPTSPAWLPAYMLIKSEKLSYKRI